MSDSLIPVQPAFAERAHIKRSNYLNSYKESISDPERFWGKQAQRLTWQEKWKKVKNTRFQPDVSIQWFEGGKLNASSNCIDRHLAERGDKTAIIWEADD